jgi:hypothetical protein
MSEHEQYYILLYTESYWHNTALCNWKNANEVEEPEMFEKFS